MKVQKHRDTKEPACFSILVEQRHAERLESKDLDEESRLEVMYRVLKD